MFWRYLDREHPALRAAPSGMSEAVLEDLYVRMDGMIGRIRAKMAKNSALFVMSDHGFQPFKRGVNLNSWLRENGYLHLKDVGSGGAEWFKDVDWKRTRAYALGLGGIYLNIKGREAEGIIAPGKDAAALRAELIGRLTGLIDPEKAAEAIGRVYDGPSIYSGPYKDNAPDLIVGYNPGWRASWDGVTGKSAGPVFEDNTKAWSGDHCIDPPAVPGVLFSGLKLDPRPPSIMDLAPTVLELFGLAAPAPMDGASLLPGTEALAAERSSL
jgi:predicted AlkP superfamily phosphohydrolase/phosphomutase